MTRAFTPELKSLIAGAVFVAFAAVAVHLGVAGGAAQAERWVRAHADTALATHAAWARWDVDGLRVSVAGEPPSAAARAHALASLTAAVDGAGGVLAAALRVVDETTPLAVGDVADAASAADPTSGRLAPTATVEPRDAAAAGEPAAVVRGLEPSPASAPDGPASTLTGTDRGASPVEPLGEPALAAQDAAQSAPDNAAESAVARAPLSAPVAVNTPAADIRAAQSPSGRACQAALDAVAPTGSVAFALNAYGLTEEAAGVVDAAAQVLAGDPCVNARLAVVGHTDNRGDRQQNLLISQARAEAVYRALIAAGIPARRLQWRGAGDSEPIVSNATLAGRQANRRITFTVLASAAPAPEEPRDP